MLALLLVLPRVLARGSELRLQLLSAPGLVLESVLSSPHGSLSMHASTASLHPSPRISFRAACDRASAALMPPFVASFTCDMDACMPPGSRKPAG